MSWRILSIEQKWYDICVSVCTRCSATSSRPNRFSDEFVTITGNAPVEQHF